MSRRAVGPASAEGTAPVRGAEGAGRAIVVVRMGRAWRYRPRRGSALVGGPPARSQDPTTSFLTAATLIYAIGAGITAAAGTRLALQWILVKGFKVDSFQLQDLKRVLYCYFSSLPLRVGSG